MHKEASAFVGKNWSNEEPGFMYVDVESSRTQAWWVKENLLHFNEWEVHWRKKDHFGLKFFQRKIEALKFIAWVLAIFKKPISKCLF
jgi:hypothetical protein